MEMHTYKKSNEYTYKESNVCVVEQTSESNFTYLQCMEVIALRLPGDGSVSPSG